MSSSLTLTSANQGGRDQPSSLFSGGGGTLRSMENADSRTPSGTYLTSSNKTSNLSKELIDIKFNELAKKILEELRQVQYSHDFFQAIDEILKEPAAATLTRLSASNRSRRRPKSRPNSSASNALSQNHHPYSNQQVATQNKQTQLNELHRQQTQPCSLPAYTKQLSASDQRQLAKSKPAPPATHSNGHMQQNTNPISPRRSSLEHGNNQQTNANQNNLAAASYPIARSATTGDNGARKAQQTNLQARKSPSPTIRSSNDEIAQLYGRQKNYSTSAIMANNINRFITNNDDDDDDDDDDLDDDEDDFGDENYDEEGQRNSYSSNSRRYSPRNDSLSNQGAEVGNKQLLTINNRHQTSVNQTQQNQQQPAQRGKSNLLVRSKTTSNAKYSARDGGDSHSNRETFTNSKPSSMLSSKDIGPLYKPHMNYSTSVLGNHRLSDDDEIIIIPTQSPSLISTSPDADANADELTERFSISRTKSFWEKLSKTNHNKREATQAADNNSTTNVYQQQPHHHLQQNNQTDYPKHHHLGNKVIGVRMNGHSHTLDRMDSTGGSNSNYSCSSSGDENGGSHSTQNPTINQLQEMSRQNRLRQTR